MFGSAWEESGVLDEGGGADGVMVRVRDEALEEFWLV
jgi:hypothetical protein